MRRITLDFETKSFAELQKVGAWTYSEHPTTNVICACWGEPGGSIHSWWPGQPDPIELFSAIRDGSIIEAHNVAFEASIWQNILTPRYGWPQVPPSQWSDTMAVAHYYALPGKLDLLSRVLGLGAKDSEGGRLISKYSKLHLKTAKQEIPQEDFKKFLAYCEQDVRLEIAVSEFLGDLPVDEEKVVALDFEMNSRGLYLDVDGIHAASEIVDKRAEELTQRFRALTGLDPTQVAKVKDWCAQHGLELENMQAEYLEEIVEEGDIPSGPVREALEIRLQINKASTKKLDAMVRARSRDGRARWQVRYHGAQTGRWTGSGFQPLNLNRGYDDDLKITPDQLVSSIMFRSPQWLDAIYGDAMEAISKATRHWIMAAPGNRLLAGDFVSIEAVILACLAGEQWKIEAFQRGDKIYERMADKIYKLPPGTVTKATHPLERFDGKTGELAFGYQGALGAWLKFDRSGRHSDERIIEICRAWRSEHPMTTLMWKEMEFAAIEAVATGKPQSYRQIGFECVDDWLSMILPNGKRIWYWKPELRVAMPKWHQPKLNEDCAAGLCTCRPRPQLTYMSQKAGQWKRVSTYGGKLTENATQATSREVLVPAMLRLREAGYPLILSVYDEIVAEAPKDFGSVEEFSSIMRQTPGEWARGWPINADVWEGERYKK